MFYILFWIKRTNVIQLGINALEKSIYFNVVSDILKTGFSFTVERAGYDVKLGLTKTKISKMELGLYYQFNYFKMNYYDKYTTLSKDDSKLLRITGNN